MLKDIEIIYRDVGGYDLNYDEFELLCSKSWEFECNRLCIDKKKRLREKLYL